MFSQITRVHFLSKLENSVNTLSVILFTRLRTSCSDWKHWGKVRFAFYSDIEIKYFVIYKETKIPESTFCKIDKRKQPELLVLNLIGCPISGKELFDLKNNFGWPKLFSIELSGSQTDHHSNNLGFINICQYKFNALRFLEIRK